MALRSNSRRKIRAHISRMPQKPLISLVIPARDIPESLLSKMIESLKMQLYPNWELCLAAVCSPKGRERDFLATVTKDKRIKPIFLEKESKISTAMNAALEMTAGEFIAFMGATDELAPDALYHIAAELESKPELDMLFSDNDRIDDKGEFSRPTFRTEWNPDLMMSHNAIGDFAVYRKSVADRLGGFHEEFEGIHCWDFSLRSSEIISRNNISRIPRILYHSRTAHVFDQNIIAAAKKSIEGHIARRHQYNNLSAQVEQEREFPCAFRVKWRAVKEPKVSLIILTRDGVDLLKACIDSIVEMTDYRNYEIIIVDNGSKNAETLDYLWEMEKMDFIKVQRNGIPFNFSRLNNEAIPFTEGEIIGLVNNDVTIISPDWLSEMVGQVLRPHIGAVGARLLYPDGTLQHGGLVIGINGVAGHAYRGIPRESAGYCKRVKLIHNCSGVTAACLLVRKAVYEEVGGLDQENLAIAFNDVDFCLKLTKSGYDIVYTPYAELYHHESKTRGSDDTPEKVARLLREMSCIRRKWGEALTSDSFYNPNLTYAADDFSLNVHPRQSNPWENKVHPVSNQYP